MAKQEYRNMMLQAQTFDLVKRWAELQERPLSVVARDMAVFYKGQRPNEFEQELEQVQA